MSGAGWQPIATAPKDGKPVDVWHPTIGRIPNVTHWQAYDKITHWMPASPAGGAMSGPPDHEAWQQSRPHSVADWFDAAPVETQAQLDARLAAMARADTAEWWLTGWANPLEYGSDGRGWGD